MYKRLFALILCTTVFLASCGSSGPTTTLDITMNDFQFTPNSYTVPAGKEITLNIVNNGSVVHNFVIMKLDTSAGEAFNEEDEANVFWQERDIPAGNDLSVTFTAPTEPGEYQVVCRTPGHIASGMIGTLTVVAAE